MDMYDFSDGFTISRSDYDVILVQISLWNVHHLYNNGHPWTKKLISGCIKEVHGVWPFGNELAAVHSTQVQAMFLLLRSCQYTVL